MLLNLHLCSSITTEVNQSLCVCSHRSHMFTSSAHIAMVTTWGPDRTQKSGMSVYED